MYRSAGAAVETHARVEVFTAIEGHFVPAGHRSWVDGTATGGHHGLNLMIILSW